MTFDFRSPSGALPSQLNKDSITDSERATRADIDAMSEPVNEATTATVVNQYMAGINEAIMAAPDFALKMGERGQRARGRMETDTGLPTIPGPLEVAAWAFKELGLVDEQDLPSMSAMFTRNVGKPRTGEERVARFAGKDTGNAILQSMAMIATAGAINPETIAAAKAGGKAAETGAAMIIDTVKRSPGLTALFDTLTGMTGGVGGGIAGEIDPGNQLLEAGGTLAGGMAPAALTLTPTALAARLGARVVERMRPIFRPNEAVDETGKPFLQRMSERAGANIDKRQRETMAKDIMGEVDTPEAQANLQRSAEIADKIGPEFKPSIAEASDAPALVAKQVGVERQATGKVLNEMAARRTANLSAVERFERDAAPLGDADPGVVIDTVTRRVNRVENAFDEAEAALVASRQQLADEIADKASTQVANRRAELTEEGKALQAEREQVSDLLPEADRKGAGDTLRGIVASLRQSVSDAMSRRADELGLNDKTVFKGSYQDFAARVAERFKKRSVLEGNENRPAIVDRILSFRDKLNKDGSVKKAGKQDITFQDLKVVREDVTDGILDEMSAANPSRKRVRELIALRKEVDSFMDDMAEKSGNDLAQRYQQFRNEYKTQFIDRFERGAAFRVRRRGGTGDYRTTDERVAELFFRPGEVSSAQEFNRLFALSDGRVDPGAQKAMQAVILDKVRAETVRDGEVKGNLLDSFLRRHDSVLRNFPDAAAVISNVRSLNDALIDRQANLIERTRFFENRFLTRAVRQLQNGTATPESMLGRIEKNPRLVDEAEGVLPGATSRLERLEARTQGLERGRENFQRQRQTREIDRLKGEQLTPDQFIDRAMENPALMREVATAVRGTPGEQALSRLAWQRAVKAADLDNVPNPGAMMAFIEKNKASLQAAGLSDQHLKNLETIYGALDIMTRVPTPKGTWKPDSVVQKMKDKYGTGPQQASSQVFAAESGRTSFRWIGVNLMIRWFNQARENASRRVLEEVLYDENLARELASMSKINVSQGRAVDARLRPVLFNAAIPQSREEEGGR